MNSRPFTGSINWPGRFVCAVALLVLGLQDAGAQSAWQPAAGPLMTKWAKDVKPSKVLPEYPRPQMVREDWQNLNGLWDYAITDKSATAPKQWAGKILVPFPIQSALSGVMRNVNEDQRLWYLRRFEIPRGWKGKRVLLNFGAVDWEAKVWVNGKEVGAHQGGYDAFSFDITDALNAKGGNEIMVSVWDPTDAGPQPRGKQVRKPEGIWYTPSSGIWQTVWLEPVSDARIDQVKITPLVDDGAVDIVPTTKGTGQNDDDRRKKRTFETVRYVVNYADGRSEVVPVFAETDIDDFRQKAPVALPGAALAWTSKYEGTDSSAAAYAQQWNNPRPDVEIKSIDMLPGEKVRGTPVLLAVTAATTE